MDGGTITTALVGVAGIVGTSVVAWRSRVAADRQLATQLEHDARKEARARLEVVYTDALAHQWRHLMWLNDDVWAIQMDVPRQPRPDDDWAWAQMSARLTAAGSNSVREAFRQAMAAINLAAGEAQSAFLARERGAPHRDDSGMLRSRQNAEDWGTKLADAIRAELGSV